MPKKSRGRGNRGRGRGNNGQDHQQPRPGRSENGAAAIVSDREEKRNFEEEKRKLHETAGPSRRTSTSRSQQSADAALSTELKFEEKNAIPSARSEEESLGPSEISLRPQNVPSVKPLGNTEKCEQTQESCVASPASKG